MPIGGSLATAKLANAGFSGHALCVVVGLGMGVCCASMMRIAGKIGFDHLKGQSASSREWFARALYFVAVLWILLSLFLGYWVSSAAMKLVF
jgi:hypothetical protein